MDKPEEKKNPPAPALPAGPANKPPHPPPPAKRPGGVPKGPVPPRMPGGLPRVPPAASGAGAPPSQRPPLPPMASAGVPPAPPKPLAPPGPPLGAMPPVPPMAAPPSAGAPPASAAFDNRLKETEAVKGGLEQKVADLERKLLEEREKVLLASLRSKEEEAVSVKVETSIKEIQDKLRREKREQELDEGRRKAETRLVEMERRLAEERETWVTTLKGQLGQRDQITQEMEMHFSARLKDLEYRWAQEKSALEAAVRDRESEMTRLRHDFTLKSEQERAFWEDRIKTISVDKERFERDAERIKDKAQHEKEQVLSERQTLREQIGKLEGSMRMLEDQHRLEKAHMARETDAMVAMAKQQTAGERETLERRLMALQNDFEVSIRNIAERDAQLKGVSSQLNEIRAQFNQSEFRLAERDRMIETLKLDAHEMKRQLEGHRVGDDEFDDVKKKNILLRTQLEQARTEADSRVRTLQARLDWYDSNANREYEAAREKVRPIIEGLEAKLRDANVKIEAMTHSSDVSEEREQARRALEQEIEATKNEWKQLQWESEAKLKEIQEHWRAEQLKVQQAEEAQVALEQELRQRTSSLEFSQATLEKRQLEVERLSRLSEELKAAVETERSKYTHYEKQLQDYKLMLHEKGTRTPDEFLAQIQEKERALENARKTIAELKDIATSSDRKAEVFKEKEHVFRQTISDKDENISELKNRQLVFERKINEYKEELEALRVHNKEEMDRALKRKQEEFQRTLLQKIDEMEQSKRAALEEAEARMRAEAPPPGPSVQAIEASVRQQYEDELTSRQRGYEDELEKKVAQAKDELKKDADKIRWENESLKEEVKRAREGRNQIEREAQELLQAAEDHYKAELEKNAAVLDDKAGHAKGIFTAIGRFLDTPIIDFRRKKNEEKPEDLGL